jgi:hypothetical protein
LTSTLIDWSDNYSLFYLMSEFGSDNELKQQQLNHHQGTDRKSDK